MLLPQVGGNARKTNSDYTGGKLDELIDIIIREKAKLFVSAVGVPPKHVVDRLHKAGILCMNMVGAPKHVQKALDSGVDIICAQGGEGTDYGPWIMDWNKVIEYHLSKNIVSSYVELDVNQVVATRAMSLPRS